MLSDLRLGGFYQGVQARTMNSEELLREYVEEGSEAAFAQLVELHIHLVYGTALRICGGDSHLARDVAQVVFADLAKKASTLGRVKLLSGWLYRHASFVSSKAVRTERRRQAREQTAMKTEHFEPVPEGDQVRDFQPLLDEAINTLDEGDRNAVVLRFFEKQDLKGVGDALGISADAAQKRVSRAVEKLRGYFARQGTMLSAAAVTAVLNSGAGASAPAGLSLGIAKSALAGAVATGVGSGWLGFLGSAKAKIAVAGLAALAVATPLEMQRREKEDLRELNRQSTEKIAEVSRALEESLRETERLQVELARLKRASADLHRLRGEVTALRSNLAAIEQQREAAEAMESRMDDAAPPEQPPQQVTIQVKIAEVSKAGMANLNLKGILVGFSGTDEFRMALNAEQRTMLMEAFESTAGVDLLTAPMVTTVSGRQARISIEDTVMVDGKELQVGPVVDVVPQSVDDRGSVHLSMVATCLGVFAIEGDGIPLTAVQQFQGKAEWNLPANHSLMLGGYPRIVEGDRNLETKLTLVIATPLIIDAAGYSVFQKR